MTYATEPRNLTHPRYRPDIDGLRAIAVLAVVLFHAAPGWGLSGFVGVDIFFVISGFLISTIIFQNLERGSFSFVEFYRRRVKRIFPALLVVLVATLVFGFYAFDLDEFHHLAKDVAAGAGFVSNLSLWNESGYFDTDAILNPLLHLWSLGIEEQFYIVWPLLLWLCWKQRFCVPYVVVAICLASFAWNIHEADNNPTADFYSPVTRFFELAIGSFLAYAELFGSTRLNALRLGNGNVLSVAGLILIVCGFLFITGDSVFPGWWALLPTLGAALMISAGSQSWPNRKVLSNPVLVWFGLTSYPLYLWHWPLISFATILNDGDRPALTVRVVIVLASVLLAWLTYEQVEKPVRFGKHSYALSNLALALMVFVAGAGIALTRLGTSITVARLDAAATNMADTISDLLGKASLRPDQKVLLAELSAAADLRNHMGGLYGDNACFRFKFEQNAEMFLKNGCLSIRYPGRPTILLIGDSFSASLSLGLRPLVESRRLNFLQVSTGFCEPTSNNEKDRRCQAINAMVLTSIGNIKPDVVIFDSDWLRAAVPPYFVGGGSYDDALANYVGVLREKGAKKVIIVGQQPTWKRALPDVLKRSFVLHDLPIPQRSFEGIDPDSLQQDSTMERIHFADGVAYVSVKEFLCDEKGCLISIGPDLQKDLLAWDYGHLTPEAADFVAKKLFAGMMAQIDKTPESLLNAAKPQ